MLNKNLFFSFFLLSILFSSSLVLSLSFTSDVPDLCLKPKTNGLSGSPAVGYMYKIYYSDFFDLTGYSGSMITQYRGKDPLNSNPFSIPEGYSSLFDYCYEAVVYGYPAGTYTGMDFYSKNDTCYTSDDNRIRIYTTPYSVYQQTNTFRINVSSACPMPDCDGNDANASSGNYATDSDPTCAYLSGGGGGSVNNSPVFDNLVFSYPINETSGTLIYPNKGSRNNTMTLNSSSAIVLGKNNNAIGVNTSGYSSFGDNVLTENTLNATSFSVSFWVYFTGDALPDYSQIISNHLGDASSYGCSFYFGTYGTNTTAFAFANTNPYTQTNNITYRSWTHYVLTHSNGGTSTAYKNGQYLANGGATQTGCYLNQNPDFYVFRPSGNGFTMPKNVYVDEIYFFNKSLNSSEISDLYNNSYGSFYSSNTSVGGGSNSSSGEIDLPVLNQSLPDVTLSPSSKAYLHLQNFFTNWTDLLYTIHDPWNYQVFNYSTGDATLNADKYEMKLFSNGTLEFQSYALSYNYSVPIFACKTINSATFPYNFKNCTGDIINVNSTSSSNQGVLFLQPFEYFYDIGSTNSEYQLLSGNSFFQYYESSTLYIPESNDSGILNSSFPFNYTIISSPVNNANYLIKYNCTLGGSYKSYNVLGDVNVTLQCGTNTVYYYLTAMSGVDYNQSVWFNATNSVNTSGDWFYLWSGNTFNNTLNPSYSNNSNSTFLNVARDISVVFPPADEVSDSFETKLVLITLGGIVTGLFFILWKFIPFFYLFNFLIIVSLAVLFFFVQIGYISNTFVILLAVLYIAFLLFKNFIKGGK